MPGPGRPRLAERYGGHIRRCEDLIADRLPKLIDNLFALADGVTVTEATEQGERTYRNPPDRAANIYLIDRILGKPTALVEHAGPAEMQAWEMTTVELIDRVRAIAEAAGYQLIPPANGQCVECTVAGGEAQANGRCVE
jgi:hypothetical protein